MLAISIHALREEGDEAGSSIVLSDGEFLSTPSARRATKASKSGDAHGPISIHALREEGDSVDSLLSHHDPISIHARRKEGDSMSSFGLPLIALFLSTPSVRRATP